MGKVNFPADYQHVMPYLILKDAAGFMDFMQNVFDVKEKAKHMRGDIIMHGEVLVGDSVIMFAEATDAFATTPAGLFVYVQDADTTFVHALAAGATADHANSRYALWQKWWC